MAGDWLAQGLGTHEDKGLSQENAYVTGLQAGSQVRRLVPHDTLPSHKCVELHRHMTA